MAYLLEKLINGERKTEQVKKQIYKNDDDASNIIRQIINIDIKRKGVSGKMVERKGVSGKMVERKGFVNSEDVNRTCNT